MYTHMVNTAGRRSHSSYWLTHEQEMGQEEEAEGLGGGCKTDMQSALLGEVADKEGGGPLQGGEEGLRVVSHLHSPIKFLYFEKIKGNETEQSEKSQFGGRWFNKQHWNKDRGE